MKKIIIAFALIYANFMIFAKTPFEFIKEKYSEYQVSKIESIGTVNDISLFIIVSEENWWESPVFFNLKTNEIKEIDDIMEQAVLSAKIVKTKKESFFEIVGITHTGHGNIYLFDSNGKLFFSYNFVDCHLENVEFPDYGQIPCLRETVRNKLFHLSDNYYEGYSAVFENDTLKIDYSKYNEGVLRIYGIYNYVGHNWEDDTSKIFCSDEIERIFTHINNEWRLASSKGNLEKIPYLEPDKIYNLWVY